MADWVLYTGDALAELYAAGSGSVTGVNDSGATGTAVYAVDSDNATMWYPGSSGTSRDFQINLGSSVSCVGVALAGHNVSTLCTLYRAASFGGTTTTVTTFTPDGSTPILATFNAASSQFWMLRVATPGASTRIGTVSLLTSAGKVTLSAVGPRYPIDRSMSPGHAQVETANGSVQTQVIGGVSQALTLNLAYAKVASGELWDTIESLYKSSNGFRKGVWVTDDSFATPGRAYYCLPAGGLAGQITHAGGRVSGSLALRVLPEGLSV